MRIKLNKSNETDKLILAICSEKREISREAIETLLHFLPSVIESAINEGGYINKIFERTPYNINEKPTLDLEDNKSLQVSTFIIDSVAWIKKQILKHTGVPLLERHLERLCNELLVKNELNGWSVILKQLSDSKNNIIESKNSHVFSFEDLDRLIELTENFAPDKDIYAKQGLINPYRITDIYLSPEKYVELNSNFYISISELDKIEEDKNSFWDLTKKYLYNRQKCSINGIKIHKIWDLGVGTRKYNKLFKDFYGDLFQKSNEIAIGVSKNLPGAYQFIEIDDLKNGVKIKSRDELGDNYFEMYSSITQGLISTNNKKFSGIIF